VYLSEDLDRVGPHAPRDGPAPWQKSGSYHAAQKLRRLLVQREKGKREEGR
jgi:hypothetical protein